MDKEIYELSQKVAKLEGEVVEIHKKLNEQGITDVKITENIKALESQVINIKQDVIKTLDDHSKKTWELIDKGIKVICVLVSVISIMAGVKLLPDIFKILGGI